MLFCQRVNTLAYSEERRSLQKDSCEPDLKTLQQQEQQQRQQQQQQTTTTITTTTTTTTTTKATTTTTTTKRKRKYVGRLNRAWGRRDGTRQVPGV
jgi:hypothetical protein